MNDKKKIILVSVGAVIIVILFIILFWPYAKSNAPAQNENSPTGQTALAPQSTTVAPAPTNVTVPNQGDKNVAVNVAVPQAQSAAAPQSSASYRSFAINIDNNAFTPNTVIANVGDTVNLEITANDKNYDFTQPDLGLSQAIAEGATKRIQFAPMAAGKFTFYCASCGGPGKGPIGYIIVTNK